MLLKTTTAIGALIGALAIGTTVQAAPSAKFTATVDKVQFSTSATRDGAIDENEGPAIRDVVATIKMPSQKELLIQISAQIAIDTETSVKGKNGGGGSATAAGSAVVEVAVCDAAGNCTVAEPGAITFAAREQELSATLGGVIESCTDGDLDGTIVIEDDCIVTDEEIALLLKTTAAHHYNFIAPNLSAGTYTVEAKFSANTSASTLDTGDKDDTNFADASIVVGPIVTVVEEVRATNNPDGVVIID
ncbi:MAG: hypothetical protein HKO02_04480 [Hyphomonadaceae bacterium]|nr:hypothetical protein [Hyphomonadaceae bacterium]